MRQYLDQTVLKPKPSRRSCSNFAEFTSHLILQQSIQNSRSFVTVKDTTPLSQSSKSNYIQTHRKRKPLEWDTGQHRGTPKKTVYRTCQI